MEGRIGGCERRGMGIGNKWNENRNMERTKDPRQGRKEGRKLVITLDGLR